MDNDITAFKTNVDAWVKQIRREVGEFRKYPEIIEESVGNIQHNYELIHEVKDQIEEIKTELQTLRLLQLAALKNQIPLDKIEKNLTQ